MITLLIFLLLAQGFSFLPCREFWITHCQDNPQQDQDLEWKIAFSTMNALKQSTNTPGSRWQFRWCLMTEHFHRERTWATIALFHENHQVSCSHHLVFVISFSLYWKNWCKMKVKIRKTRRVVQKKSCQSLLNRWRGLKELNRAKRSPMS